MAGFVALIAGLVLAQVYQVSLVQRMQSINQRLFRINYQAGQSSVRLLNDLNSIEDLTRGFFAVSDRAPYAEALNEQLNLFSRRLGDLSALELSTEEKQELERLGGIWKDFEALVRPLLFVPQRRAAAGTEDEIYGRMGELRNQTDRLIPVIGRRIEAKIAESDAATQRVVTVSWLGLGGALVFGLLVGGLIVRSITVPIRQLSRATRRLAEGDFSHRVDDSGRDEVGELARNFNVMARRLSELDQLKGDFVSHVSHELKAPLASMRETTGLLLEEIPGEVNPKQRRLLELNLQCGKRLSAMINNLLDLSRLESRGDDQSFELVDLSQLASETVQEMEPLARERGCVLRWSPPNRPLVAACDAGRIVQVLSNLIDNALKFAPPNSEVEAAAAHLAKPPLGLPREWRESLAASDSGYAMISVADRGPGVPDGHKAKIFDKFHQVSRGRKVSGQGVGLGLAISRNIAQAHRAAIWAEDNPGGGTVFRFLIGLAPQGGD